MKRADASIHIITCLYDFRDAADKTLISGVIFSYNIEDAMRTISTIFNAADVARMQQARRG